MSITVIGGGVVGISAALFLQDRGMSVRVIDPCISTDRCSYGNAGAISPGSVAPLALPGILAKIPSMLLDPTAPLYIKLSYLPRAIPWLARFIMSAQADRVEASARALATLLSETFDALNELVEMCGAADLLRTNGQLHLYPDQKACRADKQTWEIQRRFGLRQCIEVGRDEIAKLEPAVGNRYRHGFFLPNEGSFIDPSVYLDRLTETFRSRGGIILEGNVKKARADGPNITLQYEHGELKDRRVLIAAGAHSSSLMRQFGHLVPLETQRGYHVMLPHAGVSISRPVIAADRKCFSSPMSGGLRLAGTVEFAGLKSPPRHMRASYLLHHGRQLFDSLDESGVNIWMGHRPCLPDSLPVIGRSSHYSNVFFAFGHGHLGMTGAAPTGRHLADLISGRIPKINLMPFSADRF